MMNKSIEKQITAARLHVQQKVFRQFKQEAKRDKAYKPGSLGPSVAATAIKEEFHGPILSRRERKALAKANGTPVKKFYSQG